MRLGKDLRWLEVLFTAVPEGTGTFPEEQTTIEGENLGFPVNGQEILANKTFVRKIRLLLAGLKSSKFPLQT
ncbi:MAG: hypothetical protein ACFB4I_24270 [Cyanophyceae cyanobacterium]